MLSRVKLTLAKAILARETTDEWVDPNASVGRKVFHRLNKVPVNTSDGMFDYPFKVHADCSCSAIQQFLNTATIENVCLAKGERKGMLLGVDNKPIPGFYVYKM
ncbi:MAG: hypothetical protein ABL958_16190 [Bdellovibrionia bacterium]